MRVLFVCSECAPFAKTGGLADVSASLPTALNRLGHSCDVLMPLYRTVLQSGLPLERTGLMLSVPLGDGVVPAEVVQGRIPGTDTRVFLLHQPWFYDRDGIYHGERGDYADNAARYALLSRAALELATLARPGYDVIHANDWQTGLVPAYLSTYYGRALPATGSVFTIHNMAYQGRFGWDDFQVTQLPWAYWDHRYVEFHETVSYLKAGIVFGDRVTAVSRTYADEIIRTDWGFGLQDSLQARGDDFLGIVNGMDDEVWNPATDPALPARYDRDDLSGKALCKARLQADFGLEQTPERPLVVIIGRMTPQKGWDLVIEALDGMVDKNCQFAALGSGDPRYQDAIKDAARRYPGRVSLASGFSEDLAHRMEAGGDIFLMPSRYEPCGLNQLYSLRYGTVPLVHRTGGLADTVTDTDEWTLSQGTATGFQFEEYSARALLAALQRAVHVYGGRPDLWRHLQATGMAQDWSWRRSAREYLQQYEVARWRAIQRNRLHV